MLICIVGVSAETSWLALVCIAGGLGDIVLEPLDSRDRVSITLGTGSTLGTGYFISSSVSGSSGAPSPITATLDPSAAYDMYLS